MPYSVCTKIGLFTLICCASSMHASPPSTPASQTSSAKKTEHYKSFTGKVAASKVRLRLKPDLDSHILRQVNKNELLLVVGEEGDFYAVEPPKDTKGFVFRSYILDDKVEAQRVNVRLEPHVDAPIIGQLHTGDTVKGQPCALNHKWLAIAPPKGTRFYVSKEYLVQAGGPDYIVTMERRKAQVEEILNSAFLMAETECKKPYEEMSLQPVSEKFQTILRSFSDFPEALSQAKEALALLKETYLNKKIAFLEAKAELSPTAKEELLAKHRAENTDLFINAPVIVDPNLWNKRPTKQETGGKPHTWSALEESLYLSWTAFHSDKKIDDYYMEQKANAAVLSGRLEPYTDSVKDRPGDFLLRNDQGILAYLYSTQIDLSQYIEQEVTVSVSPRPNNHFAFPAYFVLGVE